MMKRFAATMLLLTFFALTNIAIPARRKAVNPVADADAPTYTASGDLNLPQYREWIFLSAGIDMAYASEAPTGTASTFENVFVNPAPYRQFLKSGTWPDKTVFMLEARRAEAAVSINKQGKTQATKIVSNLAHVKDTRLAGGWGFYRFSGDGPGKLIARPADCYQCHESHAAVDTTFVQFYPTLLPLATDKGTLSPVYVEQNKVPETTK